MRSAKRLHTRSNLTLAIAGVMSARWWLASLVLVACLGVTSEAQDLRPLEQTSASPDAAILLWEQHWTLQADGTQVYREKRHVRLDSDRAYDEFADPRITYNVATDELKIITARTKLPDGSYIEVPGYSHVQVGADASTGWPAFANLWQHLLVKSGVQPGCVLETEFQITSRPGSRRPIGADLRLDHHYPIALRRVIITRPAGCELGVFLANLPPSVESDRLQELARQARASTEGGEVVFEFKGLPACPGEPHDLPWYADCPRLTFTTAGKPSEWVTAWTRRLMAAADGSELITALAEEWTKDAKEPGEKMRALQENLAKRFNFVDFPVAWRPAEIRPASEVVASSYGLPEEACAALLALARAAELNVLPAMLVRQEHWTHEAPHDELVANWVVLLSPERVGGQGAVQVMHSSGVNLTAFEGGEYAEIWDPHHGRIQRDGRWADYRVLNVPDVLMARIVLDPWTEADQSICRVRGNVKLDKEGRLSGELTVRTTGLFVSPESLRTTGGQKSRVGALVTRVLPDANVESYTVTKLAEDEFAAVAKIKSEKACEKLGDAFCLQFAQDGPYGTNVSLPLSDSTRNKLVRLAGPFDELVDVTVELPEGCTVRAAPAVLEQVQGDWGWVAQSVQRDGDQVRVERRVRVAQRELTPKALLTLREPLNALRSEHARTLLVTP